MGRYPEDGHSGAMTIRQPVDEMEIARTAAPGTDRKLAGKMRLSSGGERRHFLVSDVKPFDFPVAADRISQPVQAVANHTVDALDSRTC
jgi:hypothetical protein